MKICVNYTGDLHTYFPNFNLFSLLGCLYPLPISAIQYYSSEQLSQIF